MLNRRLNRNSLFNSSSNNRSVLFLQGVASPFFSALADELSKQGCAVYRVNFCGGDRLFASSTKADNNWDFREPLDEFPDWLSTKILKNYITDIVLFGDARPVHKNAIKLAKKLKLNIHVYEEGYLRPHRITLDRGGVNAHSSLSQDPEWYHQYGGTFPSHPTEETGYSLLTRAWHDIRYHLASLAMKKRFPHYSTHRPDSPLREYLGWARRFPTLLFHDWYGDKVVKHLIDNNKSYYFLPLQLSADAQIRVHSPFKNVQEVIERTVTSFANHAPAETHLVIKNHPLDTGLVNYRKIIKNLAKLHRVEGRLVYVEDGYLPTMLHNSKGSVLVNSTVGTSSLFHAIPTCVLGEAIYDMEGLTFQGGLDKFWTGGTRPNPRLFAKFCNALIHLTQVNGDFYSESGIKMSVEGSLRLFGLPSVVDAVDKPIEEKEIDRIDFVNPNLTTSPVPIPITSRALKVSKTSRELNKSAYAFVKH